MNRRLQTLLGSLVLPTMPMTERFLLYCAVVAGGVFACSSTTSSGTADGGSSSDGGGAGDDGSSGNDAAGGALTCSSVGLCTNVHGSMTVGTVRPLTGGSIRDGGYRSIAGPEKFLLFVGQKVLSVMDPTYYENQLGSWSTNGDTITFNFTEACTSNGSTTVSSSHPYKYLVQGDDIFLQTYLNGQPNGSAMQLHKVSSFCAPFAGSSCNNGNCVCNEQTGKPLPPMNSCSLAK